ncbi:hypothetical protein ACFWXA_30805 [Streptomyces atroolivaceus]|uniref:hypothetical protein n=1 Tax=Streptomyces atroolivaceus TaxID=66869 RepID=UPI003657BF35
MPVEPIPCADGGSTPIEVTTCCAPSIASTPLCRADGTTILAVVRSGCVECGETPEDPAVVGWLDTAGVFTPGTLPADVGPCEAGCVDTVCRQLCDDTDGDGVADATYSELWCIRIDGSAELVLTYQDDPSTPYVPVAPVDCTYGCPETETLQLCDDGGPFLRRYTWLNGLATYEDFALDGQTPHVVTGTVRVCAAEVSADDCLDTVCRMRCDDTDADGQADTLYNELWCIRADGTAELLLTYQDDPSVPYTPIVPVDCEFGPVGSEALPLCDDSGPFLRRYTWSGTVASYEDVELDGSTPHVVTGTVGLCPLETTTGCAEQTTPAATLGLCLADGTPIAVIVTRDCDGVITQDGWINLTTGTYSTGAPPAGAQGCGDSRAFELAGLLCDLDPVTGDVFAPVLVEYEYNPDGSLASVRLINPGTGTTYVLQGELNVCPAGAATATADQDLAVLCDVQADGTSVTFLRDYRRSATTGEITGFTDYGLDGTAYAITGTVGQCSPEEEPCRNTNTLLLCDLPTDGTPAPTVTDTSGTPYYPYTTGVPTAGAQGLWDGGTLNLPVAAGPQPGTTGTVRTAAAVIQAPRPVCDAGTAHVTVQVDVTQLGPDTGCASTGFLGLFNGTGEANRVALALAPANTPAGWSGTLTVEADVPADDLAAGNIAVLVAFDAYDDSGAVCPPPRRTAWQLAAFGATVVYDQTGCATQFLRNVTTDCETGAVIAVTDTTLDGQPYTVTGEAGQCEATDGSCCQTETCPVHNIVQVCRCDDTDGDGIADTDYVELLGIDCTGVLTSVGTYDADLSAPYTPVAPIDCDETDDGADPVTAVQARRVQLDPGGTWNAASWPTLQSVTAVAHGGTGTITTVDGPSTLHTGESATWSVARDTDAFLTGPLTIAAATGTVTITWTQGVTL